VTDRPEKVYLLVYSTKFGTREQVKQCLEQIPEILRWRTDLPSSFYLISQETDAKTLSDRLSECMNSTKSFIVVEVTTNSNGWLVPDTWVFLKRKSAPKSEK